MYPCTQTFLSFSFSFLSNRYGIRVRGFSTDGDEKALGAMCHLMRHADKYDIEVNFVQDPIHIGTKLRNRKLRPTGMLPVGNKQINASHLKILAMNVVKTIHGVTRFDVSPDDRQNFNSLKKCMSARVRDTLTQYVPDSEGTAFYLLLCEEITCSFMDKKMMPLERIEKMFHAIYFIRIWRKWILSSQYDVNCHFISRNAYTCLEINGANLLSLIKRMQNEPEKFRLPMFDSQACERAFRQFRSMGSVNFTRINFTLLELINMIRRIECQTDILHNKLSNLNIELPKLKPKSVSEKTAIYPLPSDEEVQECLERAKRKAIYDAAKFDMRIDEPIIDKWELPSTKVDVDDVLQEEDEFSDDEDYFDHDYDQDLDFDFDGEMLEEMDENYEYKNLAKNFVTVVENGEEKSIRKGTLVWLLSESRGKLSKDRLTRVQETQKVDIAQNHRPNKFIDELVIQSKCINLFEWCAFKINEASNEEENPGICFGLLLSFKYADGKREKDKRFKYETADLEGNPHLAERLETLSSWYYMNDQGILIPTKDENHYFISLKNYVATVIDPKVDQDTKALYYSDNDWRKIDNAILSLI